VEQLSPPAQQLKPTPQPPTALEPPNDWGQSFYDLEFVAHNAFNLPDDAMKPKPPTSLSTSKDKLKTNLDRSAISHLVKGATSPFFRGKKESFWKSFPPLGRH
jgi:hypothetical protein